MDVTEDELLQMLEEDQAGFRIPMSLGEPHAELDASQYPQKTPSLFPQDPAILRSFLVRVGSQSGLTQAFREHALGLFTELRRLQRRLPGTVVV